MEKNKTRRFAATTRQKGRALYDVKSFERPWDQLPEEPALKFSWFLSYLLLDPTERSLVNAWRAFSPLRKDADRHKVARAWIDCCAMFIWADRAIAYDIWRQQEILKNNESLINEIASYYYLLNRDVVKEAYQLNKSGQIEELKKAAPKWTFLFGKGGVGRHTNDAFKLVHGEKQSVEMKVPERPPIKWG